MCERNTNECCVSVWCGYFWFDVDCLKLFWNKTVWYNGLGIASKLKKQKNKKIGTTLANETKWRNRSITCLIKPEYTAQTHNWPRQTSISVFFYFFVRVQLHHTTWCATYIQWHGDDQYNDNIYAQSTA